MADRIKFKAGTLEAYKNLQTKDANTLYFIADTLQLYKGEDIYAKSYSVVNSFPATGLEGVLYLNRVTKEIKAWENGAWAEGFDASVQVDSEVTAESNNAVSSKAVATYVQKAIDDVTDGASSTVITSIEAGDGADFGYLKITQGSNVNKVEMSVKGAVVNPSYDAESRKITLPVANGEDLVINLGKDMVVKSGSYSAETKELILVLTDETTVKIPVGDLVDIYTASEDESGAVKITVEGNSIKAEALVDGVTIKNTEGKLTADFTSLATAADLTALTSRVSTLETDVANLKTGVSTNTAAIESIKTNYLSTSDATNTYATIASLNSAKSDLTSRMNEIDSAWQAALNWEAIN